MSKLRIWSTALVCTFALLIAGCGGEKKGSSAGSGEELVKLAGAGASFPAPIYSEWFKSFHDEHGVAIDYQSVGSGRGITMFMDDTVDFGASDAAMKPEEIAEVEKGVQLLPMTAGAVVLAYNLDGIQDLKLSREAYIGIVLGKVTKWNDSLIAACNPGVSLPDEPIHFIFRADSSGTTFVFTQHLSAVSEEFAKSPGTNKKPDWPTGVGGNGNPGVTELINQTPGSVGYIEYGYAVHAGLSMVSLENKSGKYIAPSIKASQATLDSIEMPEDMIAWAPDPDGEGSYPIVTYTWLLCYKKYDDAKKAATMKKVIEYCLDDAQQAKAEPLGYIPLPASVVDKVRAAMENIGS